MSATVLPIRRNGTGYSIKIEVEGVDQIGVAREIRDWLIDRHGTGKFNQVAQCTVPPEGWRCTRIAGHGGPCAAVPTHDGLEDEIADVLTDSLDMDWTGAVGARAVMFLLRAKGMIA